MDELPPVAVIIREPGRAPLRLLVTQEPIEVGRDCRGLLLGDPRVSRRHLTLQVIAGTLRVTDLDSTNGTRVDGLPLQGSHAVRPGETVEMGSATITLLDVAALPDPPDLDRLPASAGGFAIVCGHLDDPGRRAEDQGGGRCVGPWTVLSSIVRRNVARHGGTEIRVQGDEFALTFPSARQAVRAIIDLQRVLAAHARSHPVDALRVRVGIHTGEAILGDDGGLSGRHVDLASRVADEARGGEILVTSLVHELLEPRTEFHFGEARIARLRGIERPQRLHPVRFDAVVDSTEPGSPPSRR